MPPPAAGTPRAGVGLAPEAAHDDVRTLHLSYQAPAECPATEGYIRHVQSRSARLRFEPDAGAEAPSASERVDVTVVADAAGTGWLGQLSITGTTSLRREVVGARCQDVVAALALITVLRFEGDEAAAARNNGSAPTGAGGAASSPAGVADRAGAANAARATRGPPPSTPPATAAAQPAAGRDDEATTSPRGAAPAQQDERTAGGTPARVEPARVEPPPAAGGASGADERSRATPPDAVRTPEPPPEAAEARSTPSEESRGSETAGDGSTRSSTAWRWPAIEPGVFGSLGYASVPSHAFKAALGAELRFGEGASGWVGALSLSYARGDHESAYGRLALTLLTLELQLCPHGVAPNGSFWLRACGQLRGGGINLSITPGERPVVPEDAQWRPWAALGPGLAAGFPLTERWELRGLFELAFQLVRDRFEVARLSSAGSAAEDAVDTLYRPEALSLELGLGLSFAF